MLAIHSVLLLAVYLFLVLVVPRQAKTFRDFNMELPPATQVVIKVSAWTERYILLAPVLMAAVFAVDGGILFLLRRPSSKPWQGRSWFWGVSSLLLAVIVGLVVTMQLPAAKLMEGLSR